MTYTRFRFCLHINSTTYLLPGNKQCSKTISYRQLLTNNLLHRFYHNTLPQPIGCTSNPDRHSISKITTLDSQPGKSVRQHLRLEMYSVIPKRSISFKATTNLSNSTCVCLIHCGSNFRYRCMETTMSWTMRITCGNNIEGRCAAIFSNASSIQRRG